MAFPLFQVVSATQPQRRTSVLNNGSQLSSICNECVFNVNNFYSFKKKVVNAQTLLKEQSNTRIIEIDDQLKEDEESTLDENIEDDKDDSIQVFMINESEDSLSIDGELEEQVLESDTLDDQNLEEEITEEIQLIHEEQSLNESDADREEVAHGSKKRVTLQSPHRAKKEKLMEKSKSDASGKIGLQVYECLICPSVLNDILDLNEHTSRHDEFKCKVCLRIFRRYSNLKRHFQTSHSKPKPFVCDECGCGFLFSANLQVHAALHYSGKIVTKHK